MLGSRAVQLLLTGAAVLAAGSANAPAVRADASSSRLVLPQTAAPAASDGASSEPDGSASAAGSAATPLLPGRLSDGSVLLPDGQRIQPVGKQVEVGGSPTGVALAPGGRTAVVHLGGDAGSALYVVSLPSGRVIQAAHPELGSASFAGVAYSPDGRHLFSSSADGSVSIIDVQSDGRLGAARTVPIPVDQSKLCCSSSYPGGLAVSADGKKLYVALSVNNTLGVIDVPSATLTAQIPVGNAPHSVIVDGNRAYVSNEGGRPVRPGDFASTSGGSLIVADPFTAEAITGTVSVVDLAAGRQVQTVNVGVHPTAMALDHGHLFVANTNQDTVSEIDTASLEVVRTIPVSMYRGAAYGSMPDGLAVAPHGRLIVTLGRDNAAEVIPLSHPMRRGLIPLAWYPADVAYDGASDQLVFANDQGVGSLADADAGNHARGVGGEIGSISLVPMPDPTTLRQWTRRVRALNGWDALTPDAPRGPVPAELGGATPIKHVVYIVRENRTYDQVLGDIGRGNSDPSLVNYGKQITPNAHALANEFPLLDNFYTSGRRSNDGHQWAMGAQNPDYFQKANGNDKRSEINAPSSGFDSLLYTKSGFLWENALRHGKSVIDFGEYTKEDESPPAYSDIPSLEATVQPEFPGFQLNYPDQARAADYANHLAAFQATGLMPDLTLITLPNDHTGGSDPLFTTPESEVADNDAGLGRIVDAISHSSFWPSTAIFVTEDDSQGGADHVDGHRTVGFVISPWVKRHIVDSTFATQVSMVRTIEQILGLPPMNHIDAAAQPMRSMFTSIPDYTPFTAVAPQVGTNIPNPPVADLQGVRRAWAVEMLHQSFKQADTVDPGLMRRDLWYESRGFDSPFPGDKRVLYPWEVHTSRASAAFGTVVGQADG